MESVLRGFATYLFVWIIFRLAGKRALSETTTFDFVLLLIISETTQSALTDTDNSLTNAFLLIVTLVGLDIGLTWLCFRFSALNKFMNSEPVLIVKNGELMHQRMKRARVQVDDILTAAREHHGLEHMKDIKFAILEQHGGISIVPKESKS